MPNILLTEKCVRRCPYCFAQQHMDNSIDETALTIENLNYIVNFLEKSNIKKISLLGGEPLLHPKIDEIIENLILKEFEVLVFTSGIMLEPELKKLYERIKNLPLKNTNSLKFIVNVNEPRFSNKQELKKVKRFFSELGQFSGLSFNIYRADFDPEFLLDYILEYGLIRYIRFGIANPIPGYKNQHINPKDFKKVGTKLTTFIEKMNGLHIYPGLDCGFSVCMFSDEELGKLLKFTRNGLAFDCSPSIDIGPDLSCWCCFPLSKVGKRQLTEFNNYNELYSYFSDIQDLYRKEIKGLYASCDNCRNFEDQICSGGCLAHILNRFMKENNFRETIQYDRATK